MRASQYESAFLLGNDSETAFLDSRRSANPLWVLVPVLYRVYMRWSRGRGRFL